MTCEVNVRAKATSSAFTSRTNLGTVDPSNPSVNESVLPVTFSWEKSHMTTKNAMYFFFSVEVNLLGILLKLRVSCDWGANVESLVLWFRV